MLMNLMKRFVREDEGMEMLEWAIVAVVFAVAMVTTWGAVVTFLNGKLTSLTF